MWQGPKGPTKDKKRQKKFCQEVVEEGLLILNPTRILLKKGLGNIFTMLMITSIWI